MQFDRGSWAFICVGVAVVMLGLARARFQSLPGNNGDGSMFYIWIIVSLAALFVFGLLASREQHVRIAGLVFQIVGISVALYVLVDIRQTLHQPSVIDSLTAFIAGPFNRNAAATTDVQLQASAVVSSSAQATLTTHPTSLPTEDRFRTIESQLTSFESKHAKVTAELNRRIDELQQRDLSRHGEIINAAADVRNLVIAAQTSGLPLAIFGVIWLLIGAVLISIPDMVEKWIAH
jgi:hypothetical protein